MIFYLTKHQFDFINREIMSEDNSISLNYVFVNDNNGSRVKVDVSENAACLIRDIAGEKLQEYRFDLDYKLNEAGEILEDIIDIFLV